MEKIRNFFIFIGIICFISHDIFSQNIKAEKEVLSIIPLGNGEKDLNYTETDEISFFPYGPYIDSKGRLIFRYITGGKEIRTRSCIYENGIFFTSKTDYFNKTVSWTNIAGQNLDGMIFHNQLGMVEYYENNMFSKIDLSKVLNNKKLLPSGINNTEFIPVEKGLIIDFDKNDQRRPSNQIGVEILNGQVTNVIGYLELDDWLKNQKGKFELRDGFIYKNSQLYSTNISRKGLYRIVGRLKSGHCIYTVDKPSSSNHKMFIITSPNGNTELELEIPWAYSSMNKEGSEYTWTFGNYGELYALIQPRYEESEGGDEYVIFTKGNAELVCVRNYLKYFGVLTDDRIRLRSEPTTSSESLGTYPINTGFRILEKGTKQETIGGDTGVWYKVRLLDGKEGWFFGAYVRDLYDGPGTPLPWPNVADWN